MYIPFAQFPDNAQTIELRQHQIHQDQIIRVGFAHIEAFFAIIGNIDGEFLLLQPAFDKTGDLFLVFNNQDANAHVSSPFVFRFLGVPVNSDAII